MFRELSDAFFTHVDYARRIQDTFTTEFILFISSSVRRAIAFVVIIIIIVH